MKKHCIWVVAGVIALVAITVVAQENKTGIGLVFKEPLLTTLMDILGSGGEDLSTVALPHSTIYIPIIRGNLKLEPEFGLIRMSSSQKIEDYGEASEKTTSLRIGCGVFLYKSVNKVSFYYGGRIGIVRMSSSGEEEYEDPLFGEDSETEISQTNIYLGPILGAEYWIGEHFSVGGEAQLLYTKYGEPKIEDEDEDEVEISQSLMQTRYMFVLRWYF